MTAVVYQYPAPVMDDLVINLPVGAKVLHVAMQGYGTPHIWVLVDPTAPLTSRVFLWRATGQDATNVGRYVGTVHIPPVQNALVIMLVYHLFEAAETRP